MSESPVITAPPTEGSPPPVSAAAPVISSTPYYAELFKSDGTINKAAYEKLPEDIRYLKDGMAKYETADQFFRGIANQQTLAGKKGLIPLADNAPPEARTERKALLDSINGVPKEYKDYAITKPADFPEQYWQPELVEGYMKWAHEESLSPKATKRLLDTQLNSVKAQIAAQAQHEKEFFDGHAAKFTEAIRAENVPVEKANSMVERGAAELGLDLENPDHQVLLKNSAVRLAMMRHAMSVGEDKFIAGDQTKGGGGDAEAQAKDIMHNKTNPMYAPLYDSRHPQHKQAKEKVDQLLRAATAKKK